MVVFFEEVITLNPNDNLHSVRPDFTTALFSRFLLHSSKVCAEATFYHSTHKTKFVIPGGRFSVLVGVEGGVTFNF